MIDLHNDDNTYTSLKDLMPDSPPPSAAAATTPTATIVRRESCREIPIKDPLLQHAAWAYLRPMTAERGEDDRWWKKCCGLLRCFNDVVLVVFGVGGWLPAEQGFDDKRLLTSGESTNR